MATNSKHALPDKLSRLPLLSRGPQGVVLKFLAEQIWNVRLEELGPARRWAYRTCRVLFLAVLGFDGDKCLLRARSLTYTTVLSLVPMLAFSFAILKGLGFYENFREKHIEPYLDGLFGPPSSEAITPAIDMTPVVSVSAVPAGGGQLRDMFERLLDLVDGTDVNKLGAIGLGVLVLTTIGLLSAVEGSFNDIWSIRRARSWVRKLSDYLTMVVVTPIFLVVAIGVTTAAQNAGVVEFLEKKLSLGSVLEALIRFAPVLVGWLAFALIYLVMPNRRGSVRASLFGGFVAGLLWQLALVGHIQFQLGVANYNKIYAGFAAVPIFLVWVQVSWIIVLFGAELAYAHEHHHEYQGVGRGTDLSHAVTERLSVRVMARLCGAFLAGEAAPSVPQLAARLGVSGAAVEGVLVPMRERGLVVSLEPSERAPEGGWQPARSPESIRVSDVLGAVAGKFEDGDLAPPDPLERNGDRALARLDEERRTSAHNLTLRELVERAAREAPAPLASAQPRAVTGGQG